MTKDGLRPIVPFNTSDLVEYIEGKVRDIRHDRYDQFMDHAEVRHVGRVLRRFCVLKYSVCGEPMVSSLTKAHDCIRSQIFEVTDLEPLVRLWRESNVPFLVRGLPDRGLCAVWANIDKNAIIVQVCLPMSMIVSVLNRVGAELAVCWVTCFNVWSCICVG